MTWKDTEIFLYIFAIYASKIKLSDRDAGQKEMVIP